MRFTRIAINSKGVSLDREDVNSKTGRRHITGTESPEIPMPEFADAMQAFDPYVRSLLDGAIDLTNASLVVTTLNLSVDKNGNRGLIVTACVPVPNAQDRPLVINTPLIREGAADLLGTDDDTFVLSAEVMEMIALVEGEATKYEKGECKAPEVVAEEKKRKSKNAEAVGEKMAEAEVGSTRKPMPVGSASAAVM